MIVNRLAGSLLAAISFILFGLTMLSRGSSPLGIEIMDRLGLLFALLFLAAQVILCMVFIRPKDRLVPLLLFVGGAVVYIVLSRSGGSGAGTGWPPLHHTLIAGSSFSGLTAGTLVMMEKSSNK